MSIPAGEGPTEIGIMYSHACNIACRHCGILSSPTNHNRMSLELAERCIREAAKVVPKPITIVFTGGEPLLFVREMEHLLGLCNEVGFWTRIVTNGFWGRNPTKWRGILQRLQLAGLDSLNFSADKYHLEFLKPVILRQAIALAQELGFVAVVNFVINEPCDPIEKFHLLYEIPVDQICLLKESELAEDMFRGTVTLEAYKKIHLSYGRLIGLGRAAEYPEEHFLSPVNSFYSGGCREVVNRPVVYPNGDLQACCCAGGKIAEFRVGNVTTTPLPELIKIMRKRSHYRFINNFGPRRLHDIVCAARPDRPKSDRYASLCDMCVASTRGMCGQEVDGILENWMIGRLVEKEPQAGT